jgi:hypothetical protein
MSEEQGYEIVMPFVTVTSKGGPHDDEPYVAGWEMGALDAFLEHARPPFHSQPIRSDNTAQADLIGMKHGYAVTVTVADECPEWSTLELDPPQETP